MKTIFGVQKDNSEITEQENTGDMKVLKFKTIINDIYEKFGGSTKYIGESGTHPVKILLNVEKENPFINCIVNLEAHHPCGEHFDSNMEGVIKTARACSSGCSSIMGCSVARQTVFFALMALAIDNDLYNEKIEIVSDAAYLMGFTEEMMEDWINAVKKVLLAERINSKTMKTEQARLFFSCLDDENDTKFF